MKAQMGLPDMKLPIQYALTFPYRFKTNYPRFNFLNYPQLSFEMPDRKTFKNLDLAYLALELGGIVPCALNAANEIAVEAFLKGKISFLEIGEINEQVMRDARTIQAPTLTDFLATDKEARRLAEELISSFIANIN